MTEVKIKKRAGRPPRNQDTSDDVAILGIVDRPGDDSHLVELFITRPTIFKKLLSLYNDYDANEILLIFTADRLIMRSYKEESKVLIETSIEGSKCNRYYCGKELSLYIQCESILRLNSYIEPEYDYEFEMAVKPNRNKKMLVMYINNKSTKQQECIESLEMKPQNKLFGPSFNDIERSWPIAFEGISKSFKRKFSGLIRNYTSNVRFINEPAAGTVNIFAQTPQLNDRYELNTTALVTDDNANAQEIITYVDIKSMKLYLKNAVDEHTQFFINGNKLVCLSSCLGRVKNKGSVIGATKMYYWETRKSIEEYLPDHERSLPEIPQNNQLDDEPTRKAPKKESRKLKTENQSTKSTKSTKKSTNKAGRAGKTPKKKRVSENYDDVDC